MDARGQLRAYMHFGTKNRKSSPSFDSSFYAIKRTEFLPVRLVIAAAFAGSARQRRTTRPRLGAAPRYGARLPRQARLQIAGRRITK